MELRDLITVFRKQRQFFLGSVLLFVLVAWGWQQAQPMTYQATLLINIGRTGVDTTSAYAYDGFYRLQADERFADTIVRWLAAPRVVEDIYREAHLDARGLGTKQLSGTLTAGRLSSQMITVTYGGRDEQTLKQLAVAAVTVLNRYTESLNTDGHEKSWFVVIGSDPVIRDGRVSRSLALVLGLVLGMFVGFWLVLLRHYLAKSSQQSTNNKE